MKKLMAALLLFIICISTVLTGCTGKQGGNAAAPAGSSASAADKDEYKIVTMAGTTALASMDMNTATGRAYSPKKTAIWDTLVYYDENNQLVPRLAKSWEISEDGYTYTLHLNEKATWHDGTPFTAEDYLFTIEVYSNPDFIGQSNGLNYIVGYDKASKRIAGEENGITKVDDHTLQIQLARRLQPQDFFAQFTPVFLPKHILEKEGNLLDPDTWAYWENPIGTGPFKFKEEVLGQYVDMVTYKDYYLGAPDFDELIYRTYDQSTLLAGLLTGEIDILAANTAGSLPTIDVAEAEATDYLTMKPANCGGYNYVVINTTREYLQDERVRQALEMAIDKEAILNMLYEGNGEVTSSPWSSLCEYLDPAIKYEYNPEKAKALLEECGWDFSRRLVISQATSVSGLGDIAVMLKQQFEEIGIPCDLYAVDYQTSMTYMHEGTYFDISVMGGTANVVSPGIPAMGSFNPDVYWNWSHWQDTTLYDLLDSTLDMTNKEDISAAYQEFQRVHLEQVPYIWLLFYYENFVYNSDWLSNVTVPNVTDAPWAFWEWKVAY